MSLTPSLAEERTHNPLRPARLADVIGQDRAKRLLMRAIANAHQRVVPLDHTLLIGPAGTGKTTLAHTVANELGVSVYQLEAPVDYDALAQLRHRMNNGDVLLVDEIHQQAIAERRGRSTSTQPEVLYQVLEDSVLVGPGGPEWFPKITMIGATTDPGRLPASFIDRFPLRPSLERYSEDELWQIAVSNARPLGLQITRGGATVMARASGGIPRRINNLMRNAAMFGDLVTVEVASHVLELNGITRDGLSPEQQGMLTFLLTKAAHTKGNGEVVYQASVNTIATAIGLSRDTKAVALHVEPLLIERGYVQVGHGGRLLTDLGVDRARAL